VAVYESAVCVCVTVLLNYLNFNSALVSVLTTRLHGCGLTTAFIGNFSRFMSSCLRVIMPFYLTSRLSPSTARSVAGSHTLRLQAIRQEGTLVRFQVLTVTYKC
jgi:hypothetical protein